MGFAGYVSICVQASKNDKQQRENKQTHTQGNNKNNEGKQHRNKTHMENVQSVTT
jgi:hypothetical protein